MDREVRNATVQVGFGLLLIVVGVLIGVLLGIAAIFSPSLGVAAVGIGAVGSAAVAGGVTIYLAGLTAFREADTRAKNRALRAKEEGELRGHEPLRR